MTTPLGHKSTTEEIRERFDRDVDRFSELQTGQSATIDAPLTMDLITRAAVATTSPIRRVLDIGCGAGNNTIKLRLALGKKFAADLLDLSRPMLDRAEERAREAGVSDVRTWQGDFREFQVAAGTYDVILAAAVLHHLRDDNNWESAFQRIFELLRPGGSVWITDLVWHESAGVHQLMWDRYGDYLTTLGGVDYRDQVFTYIDKEDSPRPVTYQLDLLRRAGFHHVELLHKNSCFAAFGGIKTE